MTPPLTRRHALGLAAAGVASLGAGRGRASPAVAGGPVGEAEVVASEASWYRKLPDRRVECQLCPRACQVADLERGGCGVRENRSGTYFTLVNGSPCTVHRDPIEKKPFFHVLPGATALSFATAGCNVECKFCQNWEISQFRPEQVRSFRLPADELAAAARRAGTPLLSATYSEPVVFWEYVRDTALAARRQGVRMTVVSNGYIQEQPLRDVLPLLSAVKIDLKAFSERFYRELVRGELKPVLKTLELIAASGIWLEIVVLLIPTLNDGEAEIRDMARWIRSTLGPDVPVHFTRFQPTYRLTNLPPTPVASIERAVATARAQGVRYVYLGNVPGHADESTRCHACGGLLIRRYGFTVQENRLDSGRCPECRAAIPGLWS